MDHARSTKHEARSTKCSKWLAFAAIGVVGGFGTPAMSSSIQEPVPAIIAALMERFGVTEDEVWQQLVAQDRAARLHEHLVSRLGGDFAGAWYDTDRKQLVVATANGNHVSLIHGSGAVPKTVRRTLQELEGVHRAVIEEAHFGKWLDQISSSSVHYQTNQLVLQVPAHGIARVHSELAGLSVSPGAVRVEVSGSPIVALADLHGGSAYGNTDPNESPLCSLGFAVQQGGFLTAAHCGLAGNQVTTVGTNPVALGFFADSTRPVQFEWDPESSTVYVFDNYDQAWISTYSPWVPSYKVAPHLNSQPDIIGHAKALAGQWLCRFGANSGGPHCGEVSNASVRFYLGNFDGHPLTIPEAIEARICGDRGDSGGPLVRPSGLKVLPGRSYAVGLLSGGTFPVGCPGTAQLTYYSKVQTALNGFGLTLKTLGE